MHGRHRGQGNGYRSNVMGMGAITNASRVSPDGSSMRYPGFYNSENRNFNRGGFGRGQGRQFQLPSVPVPQPQPQPQLPPPPRKGDVFMEAGKLAAEYLVSKGILPPNALSRKLQIGNFKNQVGDFQSGDARTPAISRLGNGAADIGSNRRRNFDEYNTTGSRNYIGGRRKSDSLKNHGSELNQELGRSASWSKRAKDSPDMESYDAKEGPSGLQNVHSSEESRKIENSVDSESSLERNKSIYDADAINTTISPNTENILNPEAVVESNHKPLEVKMSNAEAEEVRNENSNDEVEKQSVNEDITVEPMRDVDNQEAKNNIETELPKGSEADPEDLPVSDSSIPSHDSKMVDSDAKNVPAVEEKQDLAYANGEGNSLNLTSFPEKSPIEEKEGNVGISGFGSSSLVFMERGEKRASDVDDSWDVTKKPREWGLPNSMEKPQISEEPMTSNFEERPDQKRFLDMSLFPESDVACVDYTEEKTLFSASFKTCDLNLMEASEVNENHDAESIHVSPSVTENGKQTMPVDIDLTMNNHGTCVRHDKDIEVIDLENDSIKQDKVAITGSERRDDSVFTGLDDFPNNAHNNNEIPDTQDGYGLMLSELLGNDIPNCSSVPPDINSLHNDISLDNGEGILGDDDSIYMTLGEIPISFLRSWEQPTQEYGKPF